MEIDVAALTISSVIASFRAGEYSSLALTEACLRQIERLNPTINAFITPTIELAYQAALQADALRSNQPSNLNDLVLLGVPVALKDMFETIGILTTAGSRFYAENIPVQDAQAVTKLKLTGAVILGKTNLSEWANMRSGRSSSGWRN